MTPRPTAVTTRRRNPTSLFLWNISLAVLLIAGAARAGGTIGLLGQIDLTTGDTKHSDVWGWVDPATQKEYAIVGEYFGTTQGHVYIVDVSNPAAPAVASVIDMTNDNSSWDMKTWDHYLYIVDGNGENIDGEIWDISDPTDPDSVGMFQSAHNIFIDASGLMYNSGPGLSIRDVAANPTNPQFVWADVITGGHDATVIGNILYDFHGAPGTIIYDVSNPSSPVILGSINDANDQGIQFHHSGWPSADGNFLYVTDELARGAFERDITVWDIMNPATPVMVDSYNDPSSIVHNIYRVGNYLFASYYTAGFKVFDVHNPFNMELCDSFDTSGVSGDSYEGAWGCYPFTPSGNIYVTDIDNGLFIFSFTPDPSPATGIGGPTRSFTLRQNFPNPFNPETTISYHLERDAVVALTVLDARGHRVRVLVDRAQAAGDHAAVWDGRNHSGRSVASGVYFYTLRVDQATETRRMVLLK